MRRTSSNKCSCCQKSSSSSSSSGSASRSRSISQSRSRSRSDSRSRSFSSDSQSLSSGSGETGKCCSIPREYIIAEETYGPTEFEDMKDWVRSQRQGREGVGLIFIGPIELRSGDWYGAVVCMGSDESGLCDCADMEDGWQCSEGLDALSCYLDAGVPGTGIFEEGEDCEGDEDNPACPNPFKDCETGCSGCNCCAKEPPPLGPDGVACTKYRKVVDWGVLSYNYGEYIHDPDCEDGKMKELFDYLVTRGFEPESFKVATFRTNDDPKDCKVEIWAELPECGAGTCPVVAFDGDEDPAWPGITAVPSCSPDACPILQCVKPEDIDVDVLDEWQAGQIGGYWSEGDCPGACCPDESNCDESVLVGKQDYRELYDENFIDGSTSSYSLEYTAAAPIENQDFVWNEGYPDKLCNYRWVLEITRADSAIDFIGLNPTIYSSTCYRYYLISCDTEEMAWIDKTSEAVTGLAGPPGVNKWPFCTNFDNPDRDTPVDDLLNWGLTSTFPISADDETCSQGCNAMPSYGGLELFTTGEYEETLPIPFGGEFRESKQKVEVRSMPAVEQSPKRRAGGAGTELKSMLSFFGINADEKGCKCRSRAAKMDKNGVKWCEENFNIIIGWLREEASKRKLPFSKVAAGIILKRAIRKAKAKGYR